ncbi:MAG: DUF4160 domain-containing protein [Gammaproteobacteria bacterium]|nr:DUF4160 domain-containing protein [Gammaproteobacteria bacterium]
MTTKFMEVKGRFIEIANRYGSEKPWTIQELSNLLREDEIWIINAMAELCKEGRLSTLERLISPDSYYKKRIYEHSYYYLTVIDHANHKIVDADTTESEAIELDSLADFLNDPSIRDDIPYFERALVHYDNSWSAYVYAREPQHHKIHFHIRCTDGNKYSLDLYGQLLRNVLFIKPTLRRKVIRWLENGGRQQVIDKWDEFISSA